MEKRSAKAASKVRSLFIASNEALTLSDIASKTDLKAPEISMALCYLRRQKYLSREQIKNATSKGRKQVWSYNYHPDRIGC